MSIPLNKTGFLNSGFSNGAFKFFGVSFLVLGMVGCATVPESKSRVKPLDNNNIELSNNNARVATTWPSDYWWAKYQDKQLQSLIRRAWESSPSIDIARARIDQATQAALAVDAVNGLTGSVDGTVYTQKQSYNGLFPKSFVPKGFKDFAQVTVSAKKDFDIWGKEKALISAAVSRVEAAQTEEIMIKNNLAAAIIAEYAKLQNLYHQRDIATEILDNTQQLATLTSLRYKNGLDNKGAVDSANANIDVIKLQIAKIDSAIALEKSVIATIIGAGPQVANEITRPTIAPVFGYTLPTDVGINIIGHRPDIVAARLQAEAAAATIHAKKTQYYPNVSISGSFGLSSLGVGSFLERDSFLGQFGPAVTLPIFAKSALDSSLHGAEADYDLAVANYNKAIIDALGEIDQVSVNFSRLSEETKHAKSELADRNAFFDNAQRRFKGGVGNKLEVLAARGQVLNSKLNLVNLEDSALSLEVALIKSLGGGYEDKKN